MGKAIYLNLNLKNYKKALHTTGLIIKISRFFSTFQACELSFVNNRLTEFTKIRNFVQF